MSETARIADQMHRAFSGEAWHGDALMQILDGVTAAQASAHPIPHAHSIWELVLHIVAWDGAVLKRMAGETVELSPEQNFPSARDTSETAWRKTVEHARHVHEDLVRAVSQFPDSRLEERVPGKKAPYYTFYYMFHGVTQHELYHAGQIVLLKKR